MDRNFLGHALGNAKLVALRKESVDRNSTALVNIRVSIVALRKESVDRNLSFPNSIRLCLSRSPQGERG